MSLTTVNHSTDEAWEKLLKKKELRKIKNINIETQIRNLIKNKKNRNGLNQHSGRIYCCIVKLS